MATFATSDIAQLVQTRLDLSITLASTALMWYDFILTFDSEVQYFWSPRLSWTSVLFFVNRYLVLGTLTFTTGAQLSSNTNTIFDIVAQNLVAVVLGVLQVIITDLILGFRIHAVYERSQLIFWVLVFFIPASSITCIVVLVYTCINTFGMRNLPGSSNSALQLHTSSPFNALWASWLPVIVYETATFALVLYKAYLFLLNRRTLRQHGAQEEGGSHLITVVYRDSLLYFAVIFVLYVTNCILFSRSDPTISIIISSPEIVALALIGNRIMFNLRAESRDVTTEDWEGIQLTTVKFASVNTTSTTSETAVDRNASCDVEHQVLNPQHGGVATPNGVVNREIEAISV